MRSERSIPAVTAYRHACNTCSSETPPDVAASMPAIRLAEAKPICVGCFKGVAPEKLVILLTSRAAPLRAARSKASVKLLTSPSCEAVEQEGGGTKFLVDLALRLHVTEQVLEPAEVAGG